MFARAREEVFSIRGLLEPDVFPHQVTNLKLLETHISWVILTGSFAYKIKKPVRFDFVDYSTLESRKNNCMKEVELNRRFAPDLYLGVVPILIKDGVPHVGSQTLEQMEEEQTEPIEFAVKMKEFPQDAIVAGRLEHPELTSEAVDRFGQNIAKFHDSIEVANPTVDCVQVECIAKDARENFPALAEGFADDFRGRLLERLQRWTSNQFEVLKSVFDQRLHAGWVRRCHGDMHLMNMLQIDGRLTPFDGIEFNEELQWIDVLSELAFPVMDFVACGRADLGWRLLNAYLESTGDYLGLNVLRFYLVYRAMVRAKVTWLNPENHTGKTCDDNLASDDPEHSLAGPWDKYLNTASHFAFDLKPRLLITHGFSGSGKSTCAMELMEKEGMVRMRSDVERQRLAIRFKAHDKYSSAMNDWVFSHLLELAKSSIQAGMPVIVDATFLKLARREPFRLLAEELSVDFEIIRCDATYEELCRRIGQRGSDPSEATIDVLKDQMKTHDPLTTDELQYVRQVGH